MIKQCSNCGQMKEFPRDKCYQCRHADETRVSKGVREFDKVITYFLTLDRLRGATYGQLALRYGLDRSNVSKRVRGVLNKKYYQGRVC